MKELEDARDCCIAILLGTGVTALGWVLTCWLMYKDCQP